MFSTFYLYNLVCKKWARSRNKKFSKSQEGILIIITLHENVQFAIHCQDGIVTNVMEIFVTFIFMMKITRKYAALDWIFSMFFPKCWSIRINWNQSIMNNQIFISKFVCGGWDLNPRIPKEQGSRNVNVIHSKHRTRFLRDLRRWPSLATPASNCLPIES